MSNDANSRADALSLYLTGAASDGAAQADPDACLGNFRSSTEILQQPFMVVTPHLAGLKGVRILQVTGANGSGTGTITAASTGTLTWTPPGGAAGEAIAIANGETKVIEGFAGGLDSPKAVRVKRVRADDLAGTMTLTLVDAFNGVLGFDNLSTAEATAGDDEYRALMLRADNAAVENIKIHLTELGTSQTSDSAQLGASGAGTIGTTGSFGDWPQRGYCNIQTSGGAEREIVYYHQRTATVLTVRAGDRHMLATSAAAGAADDTVHAVPGLRIALETVGGSGEIQTIADEDTEPAGRTWNSGFNTTDGLTIASIAASSNHGLWLHRETPADPMVSTVATGDRTLTNALTIQYDGAA